MFLLDFVAQSKSDWKTTVFLYRLTALQSKALLYDKNKCHQSCVLESHNFSSCPVSACRKITKLLFNSCNLYSHHTTSSQVTQSFSKCRTISACQAISFQVTQELLSLASLSHTAFLLTTKLTATTIWRRASFFPRKCSFGRISLMHNDFLSMCFMTKNYASTKKALTGNCVSLWYSEKF